MSYLTSPSDPDLDVAVEFNRRTRARCGASPARRVRRRRSPSPLPDPPACRGGCASGLGHRDHPGLHEHRGHPDRPVTAHRQQARDLDEQHAPVGVGPVGGCRNAPDMAECPRGSRINSSRRWSRCSSKYSRRSCIVAPGIGPSPPVMTRVGIPSVWESTAAKYLVALMVLRILRGRDTPSQNGATPWPASSCLSSSPSTGSRRTPAASARPSMVAGPSGSSAGQRATT